LHLNYMPRWVGVVFERNQHSRDPNHELCPKILKDRQRRSNTRTHQTYPEACGSSMHLTYSVAGELLSQFPHWGHILPAGLLLAFVISLRKTHSRRMLPCGSAVTSGLANIDGLACWIGPKAGLSVGLQETFADMGIRFSSGNMVHGTFA
jgi:hypothetical protein